MLWRDQYFQRAYYTILLNIHKVEGIIDEIKFLLQKSKHETYEEQ